MVPGFVVASKEVPLRILFQLRGRLSQVVLKCPGVPTSVRGQRALRKRAAAGVGAQGFRNPVVARTSSEWSESPCPKSRERTRLGCGVFVFSPLEPCLPRVRLAVRSPSSL